MKDELNKNEPNFLDNFDNTHEDEIGMAINEEHNEEDEDVDPTHHDEFDDEDENLFAEDEHTEEELPEEDEEYLEEQDDADYEQSLDEDDDESPEEKKRRLAYAESSKDRLMDKIKGNLIYILIALILIIPGSMKLYSLIWGNQPATTGNNPETVAFADNGQKTAIASRERNARSDYSTYNRNGAGIEFRECR